MIEYYLDQRAALNVWVPVVQTEKKKLPVELKQNTLTWMFMTVF